MIGRAVHIPSNRIVIVLENPHAELPGFAKINILDQWAVLSGPTVCRIEDLLMEPTDLLDGP